LLAVHASPFLSFLKDEDGSIGIHTSSPKTSPEKIKVCEIATLVGEKKDTTLIKVHG